MNILENDFTLSPGISSSTVRSMLAAFQATLFHAKAIRSETEDLRELVAVTAIVHQLEEGIAACREWLSKRNRERGWSSQFRRIFDKGGAPRRHLPAHHPEPRPVLAAALAMAMDGSARRTPGRSPAAEDAAALGVSGAQPLTAMGQGWPACSGAGSAAVIGVEAGNAKPFPQEATGLPGDALFPPKEERISTVINDLEDIHYAK